MGEYSIKTMVLLNKIIMTDPAAMFLNSVYIKKDRCYIVIARARVI